MDYIISTESCADILKPKMEELGISYIVMKYVLNGAPVEAVYSNASQYAEFYDTLRMGVMPTTSRINPFEYREYFESLFADNNNIDIIHFALSSGLSESAEGAILSANEINQERESAGLQGRVFVIDTLSATQGMAMLVYRAVEMRNNGASAQEVVQASERDKLRLHHLISVTDLFHLKRGGRVSAVGATVGTLLNISPILVIDRQGKLAVVGKAKGRSGIIKSFIRIMQKNFTTKNVTTKKVIVAETDNFLLGDEVISWLKDEFGQDLAISRGYVGPVVGTHTGGGTMGLVYIGNERE